MKLSKHPLGPDRLDLPRVEVDSATTARLRASFQDIASQADALANNFFASFFAGYPEFRMRFPDDITAHKKKLTETLQWVVDHLDKQDELRAAIRDLGQRHERADIKPHHYPIFCEHMVDAMKATAGSQWSPELDDDWRTALRRLSDLMLGRA